MDENGFAKKSLISALIYGTLEDLKSFGWHKGMELEGKIVAKDSLTPFNRLNPEKDFKVAGKTEIVCTIEGKPIYRKTFYRQNSDAVDETIQHDNREDIRQAAIAQQQAENSDAVDSLQGK